MLIKTLEPGTKEVLVHHVMSQYFVGRNLELAYQDLDENTGLRCFMMMVEKCKTVLLFKLNFVNKILQINHQKIVFGVLLMYNLLELLGFRL